MNENERIINAISGKKPDEIPMYFGLICQIKNFTDFNLKK